MFKERWDGVLNRMSIIDVDGLVMVPGPNFYYMTGLSIGLSERPCLFTMWKDKSVSLIMPELEAPKGEILTKQLDDQGIGLQWELVTYSDEEGPTKAFEKVFSPYMGTPLRLAVEYLRMRILEYSLIQNVHMDVFLQDASQIFRSLRAIKSPEEIKILEKACNLCDLGVDIARRMLKVGVCGKDVALAIERELKAKGASSVMMSLATGPETALPHAQTTDRRAEDGDLAWLDLVVSVDGYWGDITRSFGIGSVPKELKNIYRVVLEAQETGRLQVKPGMTGAELDRLTRDVIDLWGYGDYFIHRTGHGLGLEVHEEPYIVASNNTPLEVGMVFTIEPGIYIPGKGGVRIEDDVVLTQEGARSLTSYPRNLLNNGGKMVV